MPPKHRPPPTSLQNPHEPHQAQQGHHIPISLKIHFPASNTNLIPLCTLILQVPLSITLQQFRGHVRDWILFSCIPLGDGDFGDSDPQSQIATATRKSKLQNTFGIHDAFLEAGLEIRDLIPRHMDVTIHFDTFSGSGCGGGSGEGMRDLRVKRDEDLRRGLVLMAQRGWRDWVIVCLRGLTCEEEEARGREVEEETEKAEKAERDKEEGKREDGNDKAENGKGKNTNGNKWKFPWKK